MAGSPPSERYFHAASASNRRRAFGIDDPAAAQTILQPVIPLVAGVLEDQPVGQVHRKTRRKRLRKRGRIVHGELVLERLRIDAREALDEPQVLSRPELVAARPD